MKSETSSEAYYYAKVSGLIAEMESRILKDVISNPGTTQKECAFRLGDYATRTVTPQFTSHFKEKG